MDQWEYLVVVVDTEDDYDMIMEIVGTFTDSPPSEQKWSVFLTNREREGWRLVATESLACLGFYEEYTLKRPKALAPHDISADDIHPTDTLTVLLENTVSCAGPHWNVIAVDGQPLRRKRIYDNYEYYNLLGAQGWELVQVTNIPRTARDRGDEQCRTATFRRGKR